MGFQDHIDNLVRQIEIATDAFTKAEASGDDAKRLEADAQLADLYSALDDLGVSLGEKATEAFITLLKHPNGLIRLAARNALEDIGTPAALETVESSRPNKSQVEAMRRAMINRKTDMGS